MPRHARAIPSCLQACLFALVLAPGASSAAAQEPTSVRAVVPWSPELSMRYRTVGGTALSPDGRLVAYVVRSPLMEGEKSEFVSHVWVAATDGSRDAQFTRSEKSESNPAFSPDGRWLAFTSNRSGKNQVWAMPVDGGEAERITDTETGVGAFAWSPDGKRIAYTMTDPKTEEEKNAEKEKRDVILVDQNFKYSHLYTAPFAADTAGKRTARRLTAGHFNVSGFDWSPDGSQIVFAHQPDPRINTGEMAGDISIVPADSGEVRPLVTGGGVESSPHFSPDGLTVAYVSTGDRPEPVGLGDVYVVPAAGGTPRRLALSPDRSANLLGFSAAGDRVYISESIHTTRQVLALPVDGGPAVTITKGEGVFNAPAFDRAGDVMAFTFERPETPADIYVSPVQGFAMKKVTDVNGGILRPAMGRTERIAWKSKDGTPVEGLLTYPVDYQSGRKYPLVVNVHGGPAGAFAQSFTGGPSVYMLQYFAQEGFAILRPNPRGSTGYGKDFRYANVKDWGYGDFEDIMTGADAVIAMGVAHPDSMVLMGWSYGGYMTSFAVTRTHRFKAASMGAGLPDLISMVTTTDIPDYLAAHMGGDYWNDYATYQKHSAVYNIKNVTTPTQILHGANDKRVPTTQGQEFYVALRRMGVPTEMIEYPRTPHGPTEPKFVMDVSHRIMTWFMKNLRGGPATEAVSR